MSFCLRSWLTGFALGLSGKPYPYSKREPTAYLYNGIRLPALPEWDRGVYPYAWIAQYKNGPHNGYLMATAVSKCLMLDSGTLGATYPAMVYQLIDENGDMTTASDGKWAVSSDYSNDYGYANWNVKYYTTIWANHDLCNAEGVVNFEGTEAVPVYE